MYLVDILNLLSLPCLFPRAQGVGRRECGSLQTELWTSDAPTDHPRTDTLPIVIPSQKQSASLKHESIDKSSFLNDDTLREVA